MQCDAIRRHTRCKSVVLNIFYISYPFHQTRLPGLPPMHSTVLISLKYEINQLSQFTMIYKNLHLLQIVVQ